MNRHEAIRRFVDVSIKYPASITAQSAELARRCVLENQSTVFLHDLLGDDEALKIIADAGSGRHAQAGVLSDDGNPFILSTSDVYSILKSVTMLTSRMTRLSPKNLDVILKMYPKDVDKEREYRKQIEESFLDTL